MIRSILTLLISISFLLSGCSTDVSKEIVGEWHGEVVQQTLTFYEDGYVDMDSPRHSTYEGTYTIEDGNQVTCIFPGLSRPVAFEAKISGDEMTLSFNGGREEVYTRQ